MSEVINTQRYRTLLVGISTHLARYGDTRWIKVLNEWIAELDAHDTGVRVHLQRTLKSIGGMGGLNDIVICSQAGYRIIDNSAEMKEANETLSRLVTELYLEVEKQLNGAQS